MRRPGGSAALGQRTPGRPPPAERRSTGIGASPPRAGVIRRTNTDDHDCSLLQPLRGAESADVSVAIRRRRSFNLLWSPAGVRAPAETKNAAPHRCIGIAPALPLSLLALQTATRKTTIPIASESDSGAPRRRSRAARCRRHALALGSVTAAEVLGCVRRSRLSACAARSASSR